MKSGNSIPSIHKSTGVLQTFSCYTTDGESWQGQLNAPRVKYAKIYIENVIGHKRDASPV